MKGPQGQWRPDDEISAAIHSMKIATGEIQETFVDEKDEGDAKQRNEEIKE